MLDFYGNTYVESRWWAVYSWWLPYQRERKPAILSWLLNTVQRLEKHGHEPMARWGQDGASEPSTAADSVVIYLPKIGHKLGVSLSAYHYDTFTKQGLDPAAQVLVSAQGQKWVEDHTADKRKKRQ